MRKISLFLLIFGIFAFAIVFQFLLLLGMFIGFFFLLAIFIVGLIVHVNNLYFIFDVLAVDVDGTIAADQFEADRCLKKLYIGIYSACFASLQDGDRDSQRVLDGVHLDYIKYCII